MPATAELGGMKPQVLPERTREDEARVDEAIRRMEVTGAIVADAMQRPATYLDNFVVEGGGE